MDDKQTQQLLSQLRDINGIGDVSWWPLAVGWWILLGTILGICLGIYLYRYYLARKEASYKKYIQTLFADLDAMETTKDKATSLSELLRRLAIHKYGREACAGLEGEEWLKWLAHNDPKKFDWVKHGSIFIEAPYMPDRANKELYPEFDFKPLIKAAKEWIK